MTNARLIVSRDADPQAVTFCLAFGAPEDGDSPCAEAWLEPGEGQAVSLGFICAPTAATWREQRELRLMRLTYTGNGPYRARLLWGESLLQAEVKLGQGGEAGASETEGAQLAAFDVDEPAGRPFERVVRWQLAGMSGEFALRLDAGAGQATLVGAQAAGGGERRLVYAKPGTYTILLDLLDARGFWLRTLAEYPVEVPAQAESTAAVPTGSAYVPAADRPPIDADTPFRYVRPLWGWLHACTRPGGSSVTRVLSQGAYLSVHSEALSGETLWYQAAAGDWVPAEAVEQVTVSPLQGVDLRETPEQSLSQRRAPLESTPGRPGEVAVAALNMRAQPGVRSGNPPTAQIPFGVRVTVYEEAFLGGTPWYRIASEGWVRGDCVRLLPTGTPLTRPAGERPILPLGWVAAPGLNVRGNPGVSNDNPPTGRVAHHERLAILEKRVLGGTPWYCIGPDGWVEGSWVAIAEKSQRPALIAPRGRWLSVSLGGQSLVAYEGDEPVFATAVATGLPGTPTPRGLFPIRRRVAAGRLEGGNPAVGGGYDLEDVPSIQYFHGGYALLGAYWHDGFGTPRSHGCINLSPFDASWVYRWSMGEDTTSVFIY